MTTTITKENSPEYLTVKECQTICRFKGPEAIRRAVYRGELSAIRVRANRLLILATSFWRWFHQHDVHVPSKVKVVPMPVGTIKKPKREVTA